MRATSVIALVFLLLNATGISLAQKSVSPGKRPNVIIVLSDDQGYGDFSLHGNPVLKTPALDKFANEGIRLTDFHVAPLCTPTRGQLLSGLDAMNNKASTVLTGRGIMRRDIPTMPEIFRDNGYLTGIFGKWHLGDTYPDRPMDKGFQKSIWIKGWGILSEAEFDNDYYRTRYLDSLETKYSNKYCTDLWFDEAMKWMDAISVKQQPFFTYIALNAPHGPFYAPKEEAEKYYGKAGDSSTASFLGMISNIDENMARLDEWLVKRNLKENTMVIFMNDNGGTGGVKLYNANMRGEKTSVYDGGHRAACFINWPSGNFGAPRQINYTSQIQDLLPTFIDLFKFNAGKKVSFDGISLKKSLLRSNAHPADRMFVVQYTGKDQPQKYYSCVVWNNWRLVGNNELYDIHKDPGQQKNIAAEYPDVYKKMKDHYEKWWSNLQPVIFDFVPVIIGNGNENPTILTSNGWAGAGGINTQWGVAMGNGSKQGGTWHILAEADGVYQFELSRWPPHLNRKLTVEGPGVAVGGTWIRPGKGFPIASGCLSLNNADPLAASSEPGASKIVIEARVKKGHNKLKAWFRDADGNDICAAYYVQVRLVAGR